MTDNIQGRTDEADMRTLFDKLRVKLHEQRRAERQMLDDIAGRIFDAYRAALGDDFTTQEVISASTFGSDVRDWNSINPEMQETLDALCVRHPESVDREKALSVLSEGVVVYLREKGLSISGEQVQLFPDLTNGIMQALEQAGVKFTNDIRKARIIGLVPLLAYKDYLVSGGQFFMKPDQYNLELILTENAIKASQNVLTTALVAARNIKVNYGLKSETIKGITKAGIKNNPLNPDYPFVVTYETEDGKKGEIDVLRGSITSLTEEADENRLYDLLFEKRINPESGSENLGYDRSIEALVGLPPADVKEELRVNVWRNCLRRFGVDFTQNAEAVLRDPTETEKVTFFYGTKDRKGQDNGVMVALTSDERYGNRYAFVCTREHMVKYIARAERLHVRFGVDKPLLEPMAVRAYVERKQRLTQYRP